MQSSATSTDINHEQTPYKLNIFFFGQDSRCVKPYPTYSYQRQCSVDDEEDSDDEHLILSGRLFSHSFVLLVWLRFHINPLVVSHSIMQCPLFPSLYIYTHLSDRTNTNLSME